MIKIKDQKFAAVSLFSGSGGLDIGCHMAGVPVISCLDNDKDCIETLKMNRIFDDSRIFHADIATFPEKELKKLRQYAGSRRLLVIGGPPCQPFSKASYWVGHENRKGIKDERNLFGVFLKKVVILKPIGFLLENVESILHPMHKKVLELIEREIRKLGYDYKLFRINAADFGVPQKRKRVFIFASKKKIGEKELKRTHCSPEESMKTGLKPHEGVGKFISKYNKKRYFEKAEAIDGGTYCEELEAVPPGKNYIALSASAGYPKPRFVAGTRYWNFLLKLHPDLPSWTIAAQPGPWVGPFHWTSRRLRIPEIAAIQTFPEDFKFFGSRRSVQRQIGNAVPPLLAKSMVEYLKGILE